MLGQAREHHLDAALDQVGAQLLERRQVQTGQMTVHLRDLAPDVMFGGQHGQFHERMKGEQTNRLDARVSARTQDRHFDPVYRTHRCSGRLPQWFTRQLEHEGLLETSKLTWCRVRTADAGSLRLAWICA